MQPVAETAPSRGLMRIPVNVHGKTLVKRQERLGYVEMRERGSHITSTTQENGEHHAYIPDHKPIKVGMLHKILQALPGTSAFRWQS